MHLSEGIFSDAETDFNSDIGLSINFTCQGNDQNITKTCLYNFDPLKPHFYIVKLGVTGVYFIFLISVQKHRLRVLLRSAPPRRFLRVPTIYVLSRNMKNVRIFIGKFSGFDGEIFNIIGKACFRNGKQIGGAVKMEYLITLG